MVRELQVPHRSFPRRALVKYQTSKQKFQFILHLQEDIFSTNSSEFSELVETFINSGERSIILDFSEVNLIDSSGVTVIAKCFRSLQGKNGHLILAGCTGMVLKIFTMTGITKFLKVFPTIQEALAEK